jgi:predicted PurR-regulated permease PerM
MTQSQKWYWLVILLVSMGLVYILSPVLTPFAAAFILAYLGDPIVDRMQSKKIPRVLAVVVVFVVIFALLTVAVVAIVLVGQDQIVSLSRQLPALFDWLQTVALPWLGHTFGIPTDSLNVEDLKQQLMAHWQEAGSLATRVLSGVTSSGLAIIAWLANLVLIPVLTFYLLVDWDHMVAKAHDLLPRDVEPVIARLAKESDEVLGAFLRGQLLIMLVLGMIYAIGLWLAGLELAFLIGMTAGLVSFVPYLGVVLGLVMAVTAALFQFQDLLPLFYVAVVFGIGQILEGMVLTPWLVGDRIGLHPVSVIFAVMAGGVLFGFIGILLALPAAAVIMVLLRFMREQYVGSHMYGQQPVTETSER